MSIAEPSALEDGSSESVLSSVKDKKKKQKQSVLLHQIKQHKAIQVRWLWSRSLPLKQASLLLVNLSLQQEDLD